jgi:hypothetical protein
MRRLADLQERGTSGADDLTGFDISTEARGNMQSALEHLSIVVTDLEAAFKAQPMAMVRGRAAYGEGARGAIGKLIDQARVLEGRVEKLAKGE